MKRPRPSPAGPGVLGQSQEIQRNRPRRGPPKRVVVVVAVRGRAENAMSTDLGYRKATTLSKRTLGRGMT